MKENNNNVTTLLIRWHNSKENAIQIEIKNTEHNKKSLRNTVLIDYFWLVVFY